MWLKKTKKKRGCESKWTSEIHSHLTDCLLEKSEELVLRVRGALLPSSLSPLTWTRSSGAFLGSPLQTSAGSFQGKSSSPHPCLYRRTVLRVCDCGVFAGLQPRASCAGTGTCHWQHRSSPLSSLTVSISAVAHFPPTLLHGPQIGASVFWLHVHTRTAGRTDGHRRPEPLIVIASIWRIWRSARSRCFRLAWRALMRASICISMLHVS